MTTRKLKVKSYFLRFIISSIRFGLWVLFFWNYKNLNPEPGVLYFIQLETFDVFLESNFPVAQVKTAMT